MTKAKFVQYTKEDMDQIGTLILAEDLRFGTDGKTYISASVKLEAFLARLEITEFIQHE